MVEHAARKAMLEVQGLEVAYGGIKAVKGIDLEVRQGELVAAEPPGAQDPVIEGTRRVVRDQLAAEGDAQERAGQVLRPPDVDADDGAGLELPGGLLERLAHHRLEERLAVLQVARRLVDDDAAAGALFDEEELPVALGNRGDGDVRLPDHDLDYSG